MTVDYDCGPQFGDVFVAHADGTFQCEACAVRDGVDLGDDATQTWEVGGDGWLAPVTCRTCRLSIPVVVNGRREPCRCDTNDYPGGHTGPCPAPHDDLLTRLLDGAERHGAESDPDHEVGDLRTLLEACWALLTAKQRREVYSNHEPEDA